MGNNIKDIQQIKSLIAKGKEMGFLTFEEVNKAVPLEMNTPEQFEEIIGIFDQLEIAIVDLEKDGKKIPVTSAETDGEQSEERLELVDNEDAADFSSRSTDPVRMYLREMGAVPLLDRDGEVTIAKKIEQGEQDVLYALVEVPVAVEELINVGEDLKLNRIKLKDVVKTCLLYTSTRRKVIRACLFSESRLSSPFCLQAGCFFVALLGEYFAKRG